MDIYILPDYHGVKECAEWQTDVISKLDNPIILTEILSKKATESGDLHEYEVDDVDTFLETYNLPDIWGNMEGYRPLLDYFERDDTHTLYGLDISHPEREEMAKCEKRLYEDLQEFESPEEIPIEILQELNSHYLKLYLEREQEFLHSLMTVSLDEKRPVVVIVGPKHIPRMLAYLEDVSFGKNIIPIEEPSTISAEDWIREFHDSNISRTESDEFSETDIPPLVPVNVLLGDEIERVFSNR